ncbi:MAG: hypothetical protein VB878_19055 [Pirellulaceae bacterium]
MPTSIVPALQRPASLIALAVLLVVVVNLTSGCNRSSSPRDLLSIAKVQRGSGGRVIALTLYGSDITNAELQQLADHDSLRELSLQECKQVSNDGLIGLQDATDLTTLRLMRVAIDDDGLAHLRNATSLNKVLLAHTEVDGSGLAHLAHTSVVSMSIHSRVVTASGLASLSVVESLRELELNCPDIKIEDLPSFAPLVNLESLVTTGTPLGAGGVEKLRGLRRLRHLELDASNVTDANIAVLNELTSLERLDLYGAQVTNEGLKQLSLPQLSQLSLAGCTRITNEGLRNLQGLSNLQYLDLSGSSVDGVDLTGLALIPTLREVIILGEEFKGNDATIHALKKLLPNCDVQIIRS